MAAAPVWPTCELDQSKLDFRPVHMPAGSTESFPALCYSERNMDGALTCLDFLIMIKATLFADPHGKIAFC
jgi:hypothetical protein